MKIDGRRVVVDYERGRTQKSWLPRRLGGGKGDTRRPRPSKAELLAKELEENGIVRSGSYDRHDRGHSNDRDRRQESYSSSRRDRSRSRDKERDRNGKYANLKKIYKNLNTSIFLNMKNSGPKNEF